MFELGTKNTGITGSTFRLYHNSVSPAINDTSAIDFASNDDGSNKGVFSSIWSVMTSVTNGSESSQLAFRTATAGVVTTRFTISGIGYQATNGTTTNATSTNLFATLGTFTNAVISTLLTTVNATIPASAASADTARTDNVT